MEIKAETNERKGKRGGDCNRTQCQAPGASSWNTGSLSWYCNECAVMLNEANPVAYNQPPMIEALPDDTYNYESELRLQELLKQAKKSRPQAKVRDPFIPTIVKPYIRDVAKTGRNSPCPCGSKKKYKKCCGNY